MAAQDIPEDLDPEVREELAKGLLARATDFVNKRIIDSMSDEVAEHFEALVDEQPVDPAKIQAFIETNVPDRERIAGLALYEFRTLYLGDKA